MRFSSRVTVGSPTFRLITVTTLTLVLLLTGLAAAGIGVQVLSADGLPAPFGPAKTGSLVYSQGGDIYLANADGSEPRAIITGSTLDQVPYFSLEGTKLAFGRGLPNARYIMVADADGSNAHQILGPRDVWFEWLPGGEQWAVVQWPDGQGQLSIMDVTTGDTVRDFDLGPISVDWWVWPRPPEGRELIFRARSDAESSEVAMYAIGVDGSGLRRVGEPGTDSEDRASFLDPSISRDGSTILYWNYEPETRMHLRDLSTGEELPVPFDTLGAEPQFSPDGVSVLFLRPIDDQLGQLNIVPLDGSGPAVPLGPAFRHVEPYGYGFSPDSAQVFLGQAGKTTIIDIATGETTELGGYGGPEAGGWQRLAP